MAHILNLKRDRTLTKDLIGTTLGTGTLQSKDNEKVEVPLAPLLSTSKLIRTILAESHLHPAIHGPLTLSFDVSTKALVSVRDILGTGETLIRNDNIEEVKQVLSILGIEADLSQHRINEEHIDHLPAIDEGVKLEIVFEIQDEENFVSGIDEHENSVEKEIVPRDKDIGNVDQQGFDMEGMGADMNHNRRNSVHEDDAGYGEETMDKNNAGIGGHEHERNYSVKNCKESIQQLRKIHDKSNHVDKTYEKEKMHKCRICQYSATTQSTLKIHMRTHTGEKPYNCPICASCFSRKEEQKRHMKRHTGEKSFNCATCYSSFSRQDHLKRHMKRHTGVKPYTCSICSSSFSRKHHLERHMKRHTGEKPLTCALCGSTFTQKIHLLVHMRKHESENSGKCDYTNATSDQQ